MDVSVSRSSGSFSDEFFDAYQDEEPSQGIFMFMAPQHIHKKETPKAKGSKNGGTPDTAKSTNTQRSRDLESQSTLWTSTRLNNEKSGADKVRDVKMQRNESKQKQKEMDQERKRKHCILRYAKCLGLASVIVVCISFFSYVLYFGRFWVDDPAEDVNPVNRTFEVQGVLPGQLVSLSQNGDHAAIQSDFDSIQIYRKADMSELPWPTWEAIGQTLEARVNRLDFSTNGTIIGYMDETSRRPEVREYSPTLQTWVYKPSPLVVGDELSMDTTASVMTVGLWNRRLNLPTVIEWDLLITYHLKDSSDGWEEYTNRIQLEEIKSFKLSPSASDLVVTFQTPGDSNTTIRVYHFQDEQLNSTWEQVEPDIQIEGNILSLSLADDSFAMATATQVQAFSYSGRAWGQPLPPFDNTTIITSVAMDFEGTTLAVGHVEPINGTGIVNFYSFPYYLDTGDGWESGQTPPLTAAWDLELNSLSDNYGLEAPLFGSDIALDGTADQLLVESGSEGNENVHFYGLYLN